MPIHISEISLDGLDPQPPLHIKPRRVNLIYGRNELGKTRLVEFLLSSLFRSSGKMTLRRIEAAGRVKVSGLDGTSEVWFNPRSREKLEDYLGMSSPGLPAQIARLLVVKGAETELQSGAPGGMGRIAVQEYLSNQGLIDKILDRVPKNTRLAEVQDGQIVGNHTGELKKRKELLNSLQVYENLFNDLDENVSGGPLAELNTRLSAAQLAAEEQRKARQDCANQLGIEYNELQARSALIQQDEMADLEADIREESSEVERIVRLQQLKEEKQPLQDDYHWLEAALQSYQISSLPVVSEPLWLIPLLCGVGIVGIVVSSFLSYPWLSVVFAVITAGFGFFAIRQYQLLGKRAAATPENQHIAADFERRFGKKCVGLADLQAQKNSLERDFSQIQSLTEQIQTAEQRKRALTAKIDGSIEKWLSDSPQFSKDRQTAKLKLRAIRQDLDDKLMRVQIALNSIQVQPVAGGTVELADQYDAQKMNALDAEIAKLKDAINEMQQQKLAIKQRICDLTAKPITSNIEDLIFALQEFQSEQEQTCKTITAQILAGIAVTRAMQQLRANEDAELQNALHSPLINGALKAITGRYDRVDLNGDGLDVSDEFQTFNLSELSTGAQEQVLLGLRIGLASRLFSNQPLFLILDDAFQYSDWKRRPAMVDEILTLAKSGWQIFYLSMDDHLRDLFLEKTPQVMGDDFLSLTLVEK